MQGDEQMEAAERREQILKILRNSHKPQSGSHLAEKLKVSRQVIVQDIAILRAGGAEILATPQGYLLTTALQRKIRRVLAAQHDADRTAEELETIVELGGKVLDVVVEHPLYGEIRGLLMLSDLQEVNEFVARYKESGAELLLTLTKGVHLHTIEAESEEVLERIAEALKKKGFLLSQA